MSGRGSSKRQDGHLGEMGLGFAGHKKHRERERVREEERKRGRGIVAAL